MSTRDRMGHGWLELRQQLWRISCRSPMLWIALAATSGIFADCQTSGSTNFWLASLIVVLVAGCLVSIGRRWFVIPLVIVPLFALRHAVDREQYDSATISRVLGSESEPVIVEATIDRPAELQPHPMAGYELRRDLSPWQTEFECRLDRIQINGEFEPVSGRLVVVVDGACEDHRPGERVRLYGTIRPPTPPTNPGERDLRQSYRQRDLHARMSLTGDDRIEVIAQASWSPLGWIAGLAKRSREILLNQTADSTGGLAVALVIGQRDFVDPATRDLLLMTGTAHLLSVSGLHLAIVVMLARWIGIVLRLSQPMQLVHIIAVSVFYSLITGGRPPVLRASILVGLVVLSTMMRRPSNPINTLSFAAVLLLAWTPLLMFNVGVQLSFLAVATLMLCGRSGTDGWFSIQQVTEQEERLRELAESSSPAWVSGSRWLAAWLRQALWYSGCVTAIGLPLVWHQFHVISSISVITNVCMSVPLAIALASGIATVFTAFVSETLAVVPGFVCDQSLVLMLRMIRFFASVPGGHVWLPSPPTWLVIVFYVVIALSLLAPRRPWMRIGRFAWIVCWTIVAWFVSTHPAPMDDGMDSPTKIEATFIDVGHGTASILRFAPDDVWLYDCGRLGNSVGSTADIDTALWSLGATRLRGVLISHADIDHYNALPGLLRRFDIDAVYAPSSVFADRDPLLQELKSQIDELRIPVVDLHLGMQLQTSGVTLDVLHPPPERIQGSDNANSLVLVAHAGSSPLVLPGDLEPPGTQSLLWQPRVRGGGVLMAPHHGSLQLDMRPILDWSRTAAVVVSGSERAARDEVRDALSATGAGVFVTSDLVRHPVLIWG